MTANKRNGKILQEKFERKETEESLRWSETILRRVLEAIPDHLAVIDRDLRIVHSNWRSGYEYVDEEIRNRSPICYQAYYPGQDRHCEPCHALEVFRTGKPITMEKVNPRIGTVEIRAYPLFDETGEVVMVVEHIRNISERKKMEDEIRENEEKFRAIFDNARDGILLVGADTTFVDCNSAGSELFGRGKSEFQSVKLSCMSPPLQPDGRDSREKAEEILAATMRNEPQLFEWRLKKFDGTQFDVEIQLNRFELKGEPILLAVLRDIAERKRLDEALRKNQDELLAHDPPWVQA
jgi:two-component system cell cycle sensor histidine kinase/response regulator CckA